MCRCSSWWCQLRTQPAVRYVSYWAFEMTPASLTDWPHCMRDLENLTKSSPCSESGERTIKRDCLWSGRYLATETENSGGAGIWTQAVWFHSLGHNPTASDLDNPAWWTPAFTTVYGPAIWWHVETHFSILLIWYQVPNRRLRAVWQWGGPWPLYPVQLFKH